MSESKNTATTEQLGDYIGKVVGIYEMWRVEDFLNQDVETYLEAIFHLVCEKIEDKQITIEQERFLVDTLLEAKNYPIPGFFYRKEIDPD